ncbi:unnamed protein product, partial [Polarella glacialis]
ASILAKLYSLLKRLSPPARRHVLSETFSESQRRALEFWAKDFLRQGDLGKRPGGTCEGQSTGQEQTCVARQKEDEVSDLSSSESSSSHRPNSGLVNSSNSNDNSVVELGAFDEYISEDELELLAIGDGPFRSEDADVEMTEGVGNHSGGERPQTQDAAFEDGTTATATTATTTTQDADTEDGAPQARRNPTGKTAVRGISTHAYANRYYYRTSIWIENIIVRSRDVKELSIAVEYLMVLTTMKHAVSENTTSSLDERLQSALACALKEHGKTVEEIGLRWCFCFRQSFWVGRLQLKTPQIRSVNALVDAWRRLAPFHVQSQRGRGSVLWRCGLVELEERWRAFKVVFSEVCEENGACRETVLATLDSLAQGGLRHREEMCQFWEQEHMTQEDRFCLLRNLRRNQKEGKSKLTPQERQEQRNGRLLRRIGLWLERFGRLVVREATQAARHAARTALAKRAASREAGRTAQRQRKERWKQMNRKDLTMADFLGGARFGSGAGSSQSG